jgi:hypothetical protein
VGRTRSGVSGVSGVIHDMFLSNLKYESQNVIVSVFHWVRAELVGDRAF